MTMKHDAACTIIVPNFNKSAYIAECIKSIQQQTYDELSCIIVDDGSTDDSVAVIHSLIDDDKRFSLYCNENHGLSYSRNFAIQHADTEFILPLDSDDYIEQTYLERLLHIFSEHDEIAVAYGKWKFIGYNADSMNKSLGNLHYAGYKQLLKSNSIHCCCMYRKADAMSCGLYDESFQGYEDWEFLIRLLYKDRPVAYDPRVSLFYRQLESNMSADCHAKYQEKFQRIFDKHREKYLEYGYQA